MVLAILSGIAAGIVSFLPLSLGLWLAKRHPALGYSRFLFVTVAGFIVSLAILICFVFICNALASELLMPFAFAMVGGLCVSALGFGIYRYFGGNKG